MYCHVMYYVHNTVHTGYYRRKKEGYHALQAA